MDLIWVAGTKPELRLTLLPELASIGTTRPQLRPDLGGEAR